ncbi:MAG: hypothetical protein RLZZ574_715 [Cyanobacteriota bacterium]
MSASLDGVDLLSRKAIAGREEKRERGWVGCPLVFGGQWLAVLLAVSGFGLVFPLFFVL